mgnify:CR=1 FL=1
MIGLTEDYLLIEFEFWNSLVWICVLAVIAGEGEDKDKDKNEVVSIHNASTKCALEAY